MESPLLFITFFLFVSVAAVYVHIYLYRRLFRDTSDSRAWPLTGKVLLTVLCLP